MTTINRMITVLREEKFVELNNWEKDFIDDMYDALDGFDETLGDQDIYECLTEAQVNKVREIWKEVG